MIPKRAMWLLRLVRLFRPRPALRRVWKVEREENLGNYFHFGSDIHDMCTMYRIAVYERCLITNSTRITERTSLFPAQ